MPNNRKYVIVCNASSHSNFFIIFPMSAVFNFSLPLFFTDISAFTFWFVVVLYIFRCYSYVGIKNVNVFSGTVFNMLISLTKSIKHFLFFFFCLTSFILNFYLRRLSLPLPFPASKNLPAFLVHCPFSLPQNTSLQYVIPSSNIFFRIWFHYVHFISRLVLTLDGSE